MDLGVRERALGNLGNAPTPSHKREHLHSTEFRRAHQSSPLPARFGVRGRVFIAVAQVLHTSSVCLVWVSPARLRSWVLGRRVGQGHRVL